MSRKVELDWQCIGCEGMNHAKVIKPGPYRNTIAKLVCECCASEFTAVVSKVKGEQKALYGFLKSGIKISENAKSVKELMTGNGAVSETQGEQNAN